MIKNTWQVDNKIKSCAHSLSSSEISGNDREKALELKKEHDKKNEGRVKKMIQGKSGIWKEIWI